MVSALLYLNERKNRRFIMRECLTFQLVDDSFKLQQIVLAKELGNLDQDEYKAVLLKLLENCHCTLKEANNTLLNGYFIQSITILRYSLEEIIVLMSIRANIIDVADYAKGEIEVTKLLSSLNEIWPSIGRMYAEMTDLSVHLRFETLGSITKPSANGPTVTSIPMYSAYSLGMIEKTYNLMLNISYKLMSILTTLNDSPIQADYIDNFYIPKINESNINLKTQLETSLRIANELKC